jgi:hypothetical protein
VTRIDDANFDIEPKLIARYLQHSGWKSENFGSKIKRIFFDDKGSDPIEIFFGEKSDNLAKRKDVFFAIRTISEFYEKDIDIVLNDIRSLSFDRLSSKIPDEYVVNESIQMRIASQYIMQMRDFLTSSATAEISGERHSRRARKDAVEYAEKCRFGHTFKGSFGFLIESPVGLNDTPTMEIVDESVPLNRRIMERIAIGLATYSEAVESQSPKAIVSRMDGFNSNMCDAMADIIEETNVSKMVIGIKLSPEWRSTAIQQDAKFLIEQKNVDLLRDAAKSMRVDEKPRHVTVFGRIRRVETDGNPADLLDDPATKEVEVNWVSDDNTLLHVKLMLSNADYIEAVEAHKAGKPVSASGMLIRVGRSWRLEEAQNFRVMTF